MVIEVLSEELINQIAAGEVIENPAAVVKELVENSIDSGADEIEIVLEDSGLKSIKISDNGCGISKEDLLKAPLRHATSKIRNFNDLYSINTMGFRGEALASIFSVAKTKIISKFNGCDVAYEICSLDISNVTESSCSGSTSIVVEDLFYKTPARRKYLKSNAMELKAVVDIINRFEIFYENVKFILKNNSKVLVNKPKFKSKEDNLFYVLGKDLRGNLMHFDCSMNGLRVYGYIGKPTAISYSFRKNQYFFVNERFIKSKLLREAVYDGMRNTLMVGRHPLFVICVDIDPEIVDVNIHPTKVEIKFENELEIFEFMKNSILKQFEEEKSFKEFAKPIVEKDFSLSEKVPEVRVRDYEPHSRVEKNVEVSKNYSFEKQTSFEVCEDEVVYEKIESTKNEKIENKISVDSEVVEVNRGVLWDELADYKILGQLNKTYILIETGKEFLMIDQHAADEKYYFELFIDRFLDGKVKKQMLLKSEVIHLTNSEMLGFEEYFEMINAVGFEVEKFGDNEVIVRGVPISIRKNILGSNDLKDFLYDIVVNSKIRKIEDEKYAKIASMACRTAIMGGEELTMSQMRGIIENLRTLKQPFNCPHGRPTILKYSFYELEKKFKRVV